MDPLFHFLFPLIVLLGVKVKIKHKLIVAFFLAFLAILPDVDIMIGVHRATFHNIFVTLLLPLAGVVLAFKYDKPPDFFWRKISILTLAFLISHPIIDLFTPDIFIHEKISENPGVKLLYPLSNEYFRIPTIPLTVFSDQPNTELNLSLGFLFYFLIIFMPVNHLERIIQKQEDRFKKRK